MKWGSTAASGSSFRALQPSTSFKAGSRTEATPTFFLNAPSGAGCLPTGHFARVAVRLMSQCTFWCWVLTNSRASLFPSSETSTSLNAPSGAGCLPTLRAGPRRKPGFRSQCTFWCRVLTNFADSDTGSLAQASQYTMWCWVPIDRDRASVRQRKGVSIHHVVLGAYRPDRR